MSISSTFEKRLKSRILSTGIGYRLWVRRNFGVLWGPKRKPRLGNLCAVLKSRAEVEKAVQEVRGLGLPFFGLREKVWDGLSAVKTVLENTTPRDAVIDCGAELYSPILPWLSFYGYRKLTGCNLTFREPMVRGPIQYEHGDITRLGYRDGQFSAATCMSVIEHGVDPGRFFSEMGRILKPGGVLVLSTDYWEEPVDPGGKMECGVPVKIFDRKDIVSLVDVARQRGLHLTAPLDLECGDRVIEWQGLNYTFYPHDVPVGDVVSWASTGGFSHGG